MHFVNKSFWTLIIIIFFTFSCNDNGLLEKADKLKNGFDPFAEYPKEYYPAMPTINMQNLIGWWSLNNNSNSKINGDPIALTGATYNFADRFNGTGGVIMNSDTETMTLPSSLNSMGNQITIGFWMKVTGGLQSGSCTIIEKNNSNSCPSTFEGFRLSLDFTTDHKLVLETGNNGNCSNLDFNFTSIFSQLSIGQWYYIAVTINPSNEYVIYVRQMIDPGLSQSTNNSLPLYFLDYANPTVFKGPSASCILTGSVVVDDLTIYNRQLNSFEILQNSFSQEQ